MDLNNTLRIGIPEIDKDHQDFVKMIIKLQNSLKKGIITSHTGAVIKELVDYTKYHFAREEAYMKSINYPDFANHVEKHKDLVNTVKEILNSIKNGKNITSIDLITYLKDWLKHHIMEEDMKVGNYIQELKNPTAKNEPKEELIEITIL